MKTARVLSEEPPGGATASRPVSPPSPAPAPEPLSLPKLTIAPRGKSAFRVFDRSAEFLRTYLPGATLSEWNEWRRQNRNKLPTLADLYGGTYRYRDSGPPLVIVDGAQS